MVIYIEGLDRKFNDNKTELYNYNLLDYILYN